MDKVILVTYWVESEEMKEKLGKLKARMFDLPTLDSRGREIFTNE